MSRRHLRGYLKLSNTFNLIKELHVAKIAANQEKKKPKKINFFLSFLIWRDIYNKKEITMKIAIVILLMLLFYQRMRDNLEAMTLDLIALLLGAVGLVVKLYLIIQKKLEKRK